MYTIERCVVHFELRRQHLLTFRIALSFYHLKCHHVLFHLEGCMLMLVVQFFASEFLFFLFSLLSLENYSLTLFSIGISTSIFFFLFLIFVIDLFIRVLFVFNFILQSKLMVLYFSIWFSLF